MIFASFTLRLEKVGQTLLLMLFSDLDLGSAIFAFVFMLFLAVSVYGHGLYTRTCKTGSPEYRKSGGGN